MIKRKLLQNSFTVRSNVQQDLAPVLTAAPAADKACGLQAVYQFHRAVVANLQPFRQFRDPWTDLPGQPFDCQQELVLLGLKSGFARRLLAEMQKSADEAPEFCQ